MKPPRPRAFGDLPTEAPNPRTVDLDRLATADVVARALEEEAATPAICLRAAAGLARFADVAAERMRRGGRMVYVGAGTSGRLAMLDAVELGPTFSLEPGRVVVLLAGGPEAMLRAVEGAEDDEAAAERAVGEARVGTSDAVLGITASGRTPYVLAALAAASRAGAATTALVSSPPDPALVCDAVVRLDTGPEVLAGSTRMKAGTATKLALNALSLAVMVRLGKVHGNRMVDLRVGSRKLLDRARRLVEELGGVPPGVAERLLADAGGRAKLAILTARLPLSPREAAGLLAAHGGSLRAALAALERP